MDEIREGVTELHCTTTTSTPGATLNGKLNIPFPRSSPLRSSLIKHGTRSRSPNCKNVSFSTQNQSKRVSNVNDCLQIMQRGTEFIKLRANVRQFRRQFSLDADLAYIRWTPTNKKPHKARIAIEAIREVRVGRNTELFRATENSISDMQEECAFSIIHGDDYECLDLIAQTPEDANIWVTGLMALTSGHKCTCCDDVMRKFCSVQIFDRLNDFRWLESVFDENDNEKNGYISDNFAVRLIKQINPRLQINRIKHRVNEVIVLQPHENHRGRITRDQFVEIYKDVSTRPEVYFLMVRYANKDYLSCQDLQLFLENEQGMIGVTRDVCEAIIEQYEPSPEAKENNYMTVDGFTNYLQCDECGLFDVTHRRVCHEMNHSFTNYFISASYNTYLVEDQIKGPSSSDGYVSALKRNCRFIEIDVYEPCEEDGEIEPMVHNGATSTSKLTVSSALNTISEYAFERTRYPLLIRLEIHLSIKWQLILVDLLNAILANKLYRPNDDLSDWVGGDERPTPKDFQMKIILVGKRLNELNEDNGEVSEDDESIPQHEGKTPRGSARKMILCKKLSDLMCPWAVSTNLNDLSLASCGHLSNRRTLLTISETDCLRMIHTYASEFTQVSKDFLTRVTPSSMRVDSSNLNPQEFWNYGVQLVTLNYQTPGLMMDLQFLNRRHFNVEQIGFDFRFFIYGFFPGNNFHDHAVRPQKEIPQIRSLSSRCLVYLQIALKNAPKLYEMTKLSNVKGKVWIAGVNPAFDESFQFQISVPELALIRFLVLDDDFIDDDFIGQYTIPFECLQSGSFVHFSRMHLAGNFQLLIFTITNHIHTINLIRYHIIRVNDTYFRPHTIFTSDSKVINVINGDFDSVDMVIAFPCYFSYSTSSVCNRMKLLSTLLLRTLLSLI
ncbi:unnamed protein product [Anisakis simplex]|uniref:Phosphoinositide phospholipase C n=1 Tax=Anisakis simplex TaxID=6269 RepID=A0A0M3K5S4_ANISI|nr:unnamed protein product [Anisakis simplex]